MSDLNFYPLEITDIRPETDNAVCLSFNIPDNCKEQFNFIPGQFLTLRAVVDGCDIRRSYSICSGVDDNNLQVGVKRVKDGVFSNYVNDHLSVGDVIDVMPPQGSFTPVLKETHQKRYMCLAVGSGITPILSIIKSVLSTEPASHITLLYGNRRSNSVMFKEELNFIKNRYMSRFNWINIMSQEDPGADLFYGKIDNKVGYQLNKKGLINIRNTDDAFICGPESMMSEVSRGFRIEGLADEQIHYELFANSSEDAQARLEKTRKRVELYGEAKTSKVTIVSDARSLSFDLATVGENILDAGLHNGLELPYSCKAGVCSTCKCKLIKGQVEMDIAHGLEPEEIANGYVLSCQAHPISEDVIVDFDQR